VSLWRRAPMWLRLVASLLVLATFALVVSAVAGGRLLRGYLVDQVDEELVSALRSIVQQQPNMAAWDELPIPYHVTLLDAQGRVAEQHSFSTSGHSQPDLPRLTVAQAQDRQGRPFTVKATDGNGSWRAVAVPAANRASTLVVATSLEDVDATVARLRGINMVVGVLILGGLALAGYWTVRGALGPLVEIEQTAGAIAGGDLTRRVTDADPVTEVGRLGQSLNSMLDQIEAAFRDREASEATARRSEARMRQFVADASHELRTPLTSIRGFAELYRQGGLTDPEDLPDVLGRIEAEAIRMGLLVDDLLLLARLDAERPLAAAPVDLGTLVREVVNTVRTVAPDRKLELSASLEPVVIGDESRLRQVASNLLDNAVRHTPDGTPVEVHLARVERDGRSWAGLEVRDHGPGLTPQQAERAFERFYRTDAARSRSKGGTGLGLSIVAAIVAAHGGRAEADSAPGAGATFRVLLPLPKQ
jgi:two-component system OmpR family sensor kinase